MSNPLGTADFFSLEAGDALDRIEKMVTGEEPPPPEDLLRAARVLRGSALMAGHHPIARAAAGLEALGRALREGSRGWDAAVREQVGQAVDELRLLVRRAREWTEGDSARAGRLAGTLERLAGRRISEPAYLTRPSPVDAAELPHGVRAFVAREGALIASALDRAARALETAPGSREPLYNVLRRMQSLRGLAELAELAPLPEVLDAIEQAIGDLTRLYAPAEGTHEVIDAAASALTRLSRDVAEQGRPAPDAPEPRHFTELLLRTFALDRDVVAIETLYVAGDPEPLRRPAGQQQWAPPGPLKPVELVSHGEHLSQTADLLAASPSATERGLRLYRLVGALRSASTPSSEPVASALGVFARAIREMLATGVAAEETNQLVECLRDAGQLLREVAEAGDQMAISRRLLDVAHRIDLLHGQPAEPARAAAEPPEPATVDVAELGYDGESVFAGEEPGVVPIESLAPTEPAAAPGLEASITTYDRLRRERGLGEPSLDALLGRAAAPAPPPAAPVAEPEADAVAIESLCYRGRAALERAATLRVEVRRRLGADAAMSDVRPLLDELLDLLPLALADA